MSRTFEPKISYKIVVLTKQGREYEENKEMSNEEYDNLTRTILAHLGDSKFKNFNVGNIFINGSEIVSIEVAPLII